MPHKHKSKKGDFEAQFDLPPTESARSLPVAKRNEIKSGKEVAKKRLRNSTKANDTPRAFKRNEIKSGKEVVKKRLRNSTKANDTPRAFKRLMAVAGGKKIRSGLDDGHIGKTTIKDSTVTNEKLQIRPGENMGAFASRVDAALPVSGLARKTGTITDGKDPLGLKVHRTRKERKMHKLYDQWREEEEKIQEKKEEELELIAERDLEDDAAGILTSAAFQDENSQGKKKKGSKKRKQVEEDPWLELRKKRGEKKIKLHDVALAPPEFSVKL